ncbi:hypothetical protein KPH14_007965 [Odynerus spinipes]|uniref:RING-type E3 ubiquitin transferase n=1 Tax=Odynerus spinipes TaxID=1348599 RepID=A0AAD9RK78_9HYME|nr:hypothetical protein KPH14_007965 [Odynerus spinipes]
MEDNMEYSEEEVEEVEEAEERDRTPERITPPVEDVPEENVPLPNNEQNDSDTVTVLDSSSNDEVAKCQQVSATKPVPNNNEEDTDADSDQSCPICMELWTTTGEHRLCCLRCGHLFGRSCLLKWLQVSCSASNRRCPQCNRKAAVKDIRMLYAKKLVCIDTSELEVLKDQLSTVTAEKNRIEVELSKCSLRQKLYEQQLTNMKTHIAELESQLSTVKQDFNRCQSTSTKTSTKFHLERSLEICKEDGCRVLDYNPWYGLLVVSQKSTNSLFAGYGIKKVDVENLVPRQFVFLHTQAIRDITFHTSQQSVLLSVGFDKCAKLIDIQNNIVMHTYTTDFTLWSCCWSGDDPNTFFAGTQNGSIMQFDIRQTSSFVGLLESPGDRSPVISLATVPANAGSGISRGGFIACHLSSCCTYEKTESTYKPKSMQLQGPFIAVRYDKKNNHALISCRPNEQLPHARHIVCSIEKGNDEMVLCNIVHTFYAGNSQRFMSRPCHICVDNDTLVAAHQESINSIPLWSISTGKQIYTLPVSDPVIDMSSFKINDNVYLATLSTKKLRIYSHSSL